MDLVANSLMNEALTAFNIDSLGFCLLWVFLGAGSSKLFIDMVVQTFHIFFKRDQHPLATGASLSLHALYSIGFYYFSKMTWNNISNSCPDIFANHATPE